MTNSRIDNLSPIIENKNVQDSRKTFEESNPLQQIVCPTNSNQNYACSICARLRLVCPFTRINMCTHLQRPKIQTRQIYANKKDINIAPQRLRTFSMGTPYTNISRTIIQQPPFGLQNTNLLIPRVQQKPPFPIQTRKVLIPQAEQIIYYPVIHNKLILNRSHQQFSPTSTPPRSRKNTRINSSEGVLTPTQFKQLMNSLRQE